MAFSEVLEQRTRNAKHYHDPLTGQRRAVLTLHDQHYEDDFGRMQDTDEAFADSDIAGFAHKADRLRHRLHVTTDGKRRWYPRRAVLTEYVEFDKLQYRFAVGDWRVLPLGTPARSANTLTWTKPDYSLKLTNIWRKVKIEAVLQNATVAKPLRWGVSLVGLTYSNGDLISDADSTVVGHVEKPAGWDANGSEQVPNITVNSSYANGYITFTADLSTAEYPVVIDPTFTDGYGGDVTTSFDGAVSEDNSNANEGTGTLLHMRAGAGIRVNLTIKFDYSSIPGGATVTSGTMTFWNGFVRANNANGYAHRILAANNGWLEACTWNYAQPSTVRWAGDTGANGGTDAGCSVSGTDYAAAVAGTFSFGHNDAVGTQYDATLDAAELQTQLAANYGFVIVDGGTLHTVCSSDHATTGYRPYLTVVYTTGGAIAKNVNEILQLVEANRRVFAFRRPLAEIVQVAEARSRNLTMTRNKAETVIISEAPARSLGLLRRLTETIRLLEATKSSRRLLARVAEIVQTVETSGKGIATSIVRNIAEAIQIAETISRFQGLVRALSESLPLGEVSRRNLTLRRTHSETMQIAEVQSRPMAMFRRLAETFQISETAYKAARWLRLVSETVQIGESVSRIRGFFKTIAETLQIIEASNHAFRQAQALVKYVSETLQLLEVASRVKRPLGHLSIDIQRGYARIQVSGRQLAVNIQRGLLRIWHNS